MDLYCERCGPEFWAEPINAWSNLSFIAAAIAASLSARRHGTFSVPVAILVILAATVGVGSFLFHTFATVWAKWLDLIPILLFQLYFVWVYTRQQINLRRIAAAGIVAGLLIATFALEGQYHILNGSLMYLPAWLLLAAFGMYHIRQSKNQAWLLVFATITLFLALVFRTVDQMLCETFPYGTHFLWHLCNGVTFFLVIQSLIGNPRPSTNPNALAG